MEMKHIARVTQQVNGRAGALSRVYVLGVPIESSQLKLRVKQGTIKGAVWIWSSAEPLVLHLDAGLELGVYEGVSGRGGLMVVHSAWIMIRPQYFKQNFLIQSRNCKEPRI